MEEAIKNIEKQLRDALIGEDIMCITVTKERDASLVLDMNMGAVVEHKNPSGKITIEIDVVRKD